MSQHLATTVSSATLRPLRLGATLRNFLELRVVAAFTGSGAFVGVLTAVFCIFVLAMAAFAPGKDIREPAIESDFPDPHVLALPDGWYYGYATQTTRGGATLNIQVARSRNLVDWEHIGDALPKKPTWASRTQNFWAPQVIHDAELNQYFLYFAAEHNSKSGHCLGVATADAPAGPFVDSGEPLLCGKFVQAIDPAPFDD